MVYCRLPWRRGLLGAGTANSLKTPSLSFCLKRFSVCPSQRMSPSPAELSCWVLFSLEHPEQWLESHRVCHTWERIAHYFCTPLNLVISLFNAMFPPLSAKTWKKVGRVHIGRFDSLFCSAFVLFIFSCFVSLAALGVEPRTSFIKTNHRAIFLAYILALELASFIRNWGISYWVISFS